MPKVSIIVPIYNVESYIEKTVNSLFIQTERDIEIILVDDGSTDKSGKLCDEFAKKDSRIVVIHKENGGLSSARNVGARRAKSEYIIFLDGDDYLREDAVERLLIVAEQYPSDFIQFHYQEVKEGQKPIVYKSSNEIYQAHTSKELFENLYRLGGVAASGATKFMRRKLALENPFAVIQHEDEIWCTNVFQKDLTVTYISDELYFYVMRENSIIRSCFNHKKLDAFIASEERIKVLTQLKLENLLCFEYDRLFHLIVSLYNEAKKAKDLYALDLIQKNFEKHKKNIRNYALLNKKFKLLFRLMCFNYNFVELYRIYWKLGKDRDVR